MEEKKKAQISIEVLVIVGILIIGAVIFASYYLADLRTKVDTSSKLQGSYTEVEENVQGGESISTIEECENGDCIPPETCETCPQDCGTCPIPDSPILNLSLVPDQDTPQGAVGNNKFGIDAELSGYTGTDSIYIKTVEVLDAKNLPTATCYYDTNLIPTTGLNLNLEMTKDQVDGKFKIPLDQFSCTTYGEKHIVLTAGNNSINVEENINKTIDYLFAELTLNPDGSTTRNSNFGIDVNVNNYNSDSYIYIRAIHIKDSNTNQFVDYCEYDSDTIDGIDGLPLQIKMTKTDNDYYFPLTNLSCNKEGSYFIALTLQDSDENPSYGSVAVIEKDINLGICDIPTGLGESELNPAIIDSVIDLDCIRYNLSKHFKLITTLDLNHATLSGQSWYNDVNGWNPIGTENAKFTGSFDGNGNSIENLYMRNTGGRGLFLSSNGAKFKNLNLTNIDINAGVGGGLILRLSNSEVSNVHVTGSYLNASNWSGGLVGIVSDSNISHSSFTGTFSAIPSITGGLIGYIEPKDDSWSYISDCHFSGTYSSNSSISGGLIGDAAGAIINRCYTTGTVSGQKGGVGGLVGFHGQILDSYSTASVNGTDGGTGGLGDRISVTNSYSVGPVSGTYGVGGLIANTSSGAISSYWDINTSNQNTSAGGIGKTTTEMKQQATFVDWDFNSIWAIDSEINSGYPYLLPITEEIDIDVNILIKDIDYQNTTIEAIEKNIDIEKKIIK